jgi:hypothetical protein
VARSDTVSVDEVLKGVSARTVVDAASELIAVPSVSGDEFAVMETARRYLTGHGVRVATAARDAKRPNLIATVGTGQPVLAMNGHLDTVPAADLGAWRTDPHRATEADGRLHGLGALDMKSCCAVMMVCAARLQRYADRLKGSLQVQLVSDEEDGAYYGTMCARGDQGRPRGPSGYGADVRVQQPQAYPRGTRHVQVYGDVSRPAHAYGDGARRRRQPDCPRRPRSPRARARPAPLISELAARVK